jgi:threonine/homoserine/homoserine lactone efflux protein
VTSALRGGFGAGVRIAIAPLLTDTPIVAIAVAAVSSVPDGWLRGIALVGGLALVATGVAEILSARRTAAHVEADGGSSGDVLKGAIVNLLNPHPWIFWIGVGGPILVTAWRDTPVRAVAFLAGFYAAIIGSKVVIATVVAAGRKRLTSEMRYRLIVTGGGLLVVFGAFLAVRGA